MEVVVGVEATGIKSASTRAVVVELAAGRTQHNVGDLKHGRFFYQFAAEFDLAKPRDIKVLIWNSCVNNFDFDEPSLDAIQPEDFAT